MKTYNDFVVERRRKCRTYKIVVCQWMDTKGESERFVTSCILILCSLHIYTEQCTTKQEHCLMYTFSIMRKISWKTVTIITKSFKLIRKLLVCDLQLIEIDFSPFVLEFFLSILIAYSKWNTRSFTYSKRSTLELIFTFGKEWTSTKHYKFCGVSTSVWLYRKINSKATISCWGLTEDSM